MKQEHERGHLGVPRNGQHVHHFLSAEKVQSRKLIPSFVQKVEQMTQQLFL